MGVKDIHKRRRVEILAHRGGAGGRAPENSLFAFDTGIEDGADVLEMDVHLTLDGDVVVAHDPVFLDTHGKHRRFDESTVQSILEQTDSVPTFRSVLERYPNARFNIDLKADSALLAEQTVDCLRRNQAVSRSVVASFIPQILDYTRAVAPDIVTSMHPTEVRRVVLGHFLRVIPKTRSRILQVPVRHGVIPIVTRRFVRYAHRHGFEVHVWTINDPQSAVQLAKIGVNAIVTDDVRAIHAALNAHGYRGNRNDE